ncbi:MAG: electron transport complex subunit RsxG [Pseudomonadota bacterium]
MSGVLRTGLTLAAVAAVCTAIVALTYELTDERIAANRKAHAEALLAPALEGLAYDSGVTDDPLTLPPPHELPGDDPATVYRVYRNGEAAAALFAVTANDGYAGPIRILVGVGIDGTVSGVRIVSHEETPGLGDKIESTRSDWVFQFDGKSLASPVPGRWSIRADGGAFDQVTGASVSSRAVLQAVRETLLYFGANREALFSAPGDQGVRDDRQP